MSKTESGSEPSPPIDITDIEDIERKSVTLKDGSDGRIYYSESMGIEGPSVTTATSQRVSPGKDAAIQGWRDRYDGSSDYCSPHWEDQLNYKGWRGTLIHYACLDTLGSVSDGNESYYSKVGDTDRGFEEYWAEYKLKTFGEYDGEDAWQKCARDIYWAQEKFKDICEEHGLNEDTTVAVEEYILDPQYEYGGQADLVYTDEDGNVVLGDIKTGSGVRMDNKIQLAAYAFALPYDIERVEVWRIYPDKKEVEIQSNEDWDRTLDSLYEQFLGLVYRSKSLIPKDH